MTTPIPVEAMSTLIQQGTAQPLLSGTVPGPVRYQHHWWAVLHGQTDYRLVTDPVQVDVFNRAAQRLAQAWVATQQAGDAQ